MIHNLAQRMVRTLAVLVLLSSMFFSSPAANSTPAMAQAEADECTYTIPNEVDTIDGTKNYAQVKPGDVLCLPAGIRENIKLRSLHGSEGAPITIRNSGGQVVITGQRFPNGGISVLDSSFIRITGSGVVSKCGALYPPEEQECGIEIDHANKGIKIETEGEVGHLEIDHVFIDHTNPITETRGIAIHPLEGQLISGFYVHHNHVVSTSAEGIYVGTEPHDRPLDILGKLEHVDVSYNLIEEIGFDGIKIKVAVNDVKVHHNVIRNVGLSHTENHQSGILAAFSVGDYYNNFISTWCEGIKMERTLENANTRYFNNVVVGAQCDGITTRDDTALVYNNTVVLSEPIGIEANGDYAQIFDNIVAGTTGIPIKGKKFNVHNNFTGPVSAAGFVDPETGNYRLKIQSPAIEAGRSSGIFPAFDFDEFSRPQGWVTDLGAYEYQLPYSRVLLPILSSAALP